MLQKKYLPFSWEQIDEISDLKRLELVLDALPDEDIIRALKAMRKNGRNEYPVEPMWRATIAGVVFQHESIESLIRELNRNSELLNRCGFCPIPIQHIDKYSLEQDENGGRPKVVVKQFPIYSTAPSSHNFSRFLSNVAKLEQRDGLISKMMDRMGGELRESLPDFGKHLGYDGKSIESNSTGRKSNKTGETSDPDADWGVHTTSGFNSATGKAWKSVKRWFGYKLHVIADTKYEIPVAMSLTKASVSEYKELNRMIDKLFAQNPELVERCEYFSADKGLDSGSLKKKFWNEYGTDPIIGIREMWRVELENQNYIAGQKIMRPLREDINNIFYTEKGEVWCRCPITKVESKLVGWGYEEERGTLKFRCPAAAHNLNCVGREKCHKNAGRKNSEYGLSIRVPLDKDPRIFTPTPYGSVTWEREYKLRNSIERINSRVDNSFKLERHFIRGKAKMTARTGLALSVMMALAIGHIKAGRADKMRSLVSGCAPRAG